MEWLQLEAIQDAKEPHEFDYEYQIGDYIINITNMEDSWYARLLYEHSVVSHLGFNKDLKKGQILALQNARKYFQGLADKIANDLIAGLFKDKELLEE